MKTPKPKKKSLSQQLAEYKDNYEVSNRRYEQCSHQIIALRQAFNSVLKRRGSAYESFVSGCDREDLTWDQIFIELGRLIESRQRFDSMGDFEHRMLCRLKELEDKFPKPKTVEDLIKDQ